jgi:hypothetical protein
VNKLTKDIRLWVFALLGRNWGGLLESWTFGLAAGFENFKVGANIICIGIVRITKIIKYFV